VLKTAPTSCRRFLFQQSNPLFYIFALLSLLFLPIDILRLTGDGQDADDGDIRGAHLGRQTIALVDKNPADKKKDYEQSPYESVELARVHRIMHVIPAPELFFGAEYPKRRGIDGRKRQKNVVGDKSIRSVEIVDDGGKKDECPDIGHPSPEFKRL